MPYFFASTSITHLPSTSSAKSTKTKYKAPSPVVKSTLMPVLSPQPIIFTPSSNKSHKSPPTCTLSLAHAHVDSTSFAHASRSSEAIVVLPDRSELQSPIQEDEVQAFRFPVTAALAGEDAGYVQYKQPLRSRANTNVSRRAVGKGRKSSAEINCIPFPRSVTEGRVSPVSPTSSTTSYSSASTFSTNSYTSRSTASSTTSISSVSSTATCSSTASLELKLASFPVPPPTPPHVLLRVRQVQGQRSTPQLPPSPTRRSRKLSVHLKPSNGKSKSNTNATSSPIHARSLLNLAAALGKAAAPPLKASVSVPPSSARAAVPPLVRRGLVDDRERAVPRVEVVRPGSPVPHSRSQRRQREVLDESEHEQEADAKNKEVQDDSENLKSETLAFEPPPYCAPPPPYSPSVSPPPPTSAPAAPTLAVSPVDPQDRPLPAPPVQKLDVQIHAPVPKPVYVNPPPSPPVLQPSSSSSSTSTSSLITKPPPLSPAQPSTRRSQTRISASELRILLTLYRTVVVGLERRYRAGEEEQASGRGETEKMNGNADGKEKEKGRFPLVEDDDDETQSVFWVVDDTEDEEEGEVVRLRKAQSDEEEEEYIPRRRPPPTRAPPNSPVGSPPLSYSARSSRDSYSSSSGISVSPPRTQPTPQPSQTPAQQRTADLDVQDALLAIRLRGFLKAQGVDEAELEVVFDEAEPREEEDDDEAMAAEIDRALAEMRAAAAAAENEPKVGALIVEAEDEKRTTMTTIEGGMHQHPHPPSPRHRSSRPLNFVPLPTVVEKRPIRSSPPSPPLVLKGKSSAFGSPNMNSSGRTSPSPPPSVSYMIALLTMRHRYASRRRSSAGSSSAAGMGYPTWKRGSALKSVAWVATAEEDVECEMGGLNGMGTIEEREEEEGDGEIDVDSVVDLYAGM